MVLRSVLGALNKDIPLKTAGLKVKGLNSQRPWRFKKITTKSVSLKQNIKKSV